MKSKHSFGVFFYMRQGRISNGKAPLYVGITVDKQRINMALKHKVAPENWNEAMGMAKPRTDDLKMINTHLEQVRADIVACYHDLIREKKNVTAESVKARYLGIDESSYTLGMLIDYHNEKLKERLTHGTMKNYYTTGRYLRKFMQDNYNRDDIPLSELDFKFIMEFEYYLMKNPMKSHDPLANNGLMKHMERLKKLSRLAVSLEWLAKDPFEKYKLKLHKTDRSFLNEQELLQLQHAELSDPQLRYARDLFIFSCYTGLAYCDLKDLKKDNIVIGIDGGRWIHTQRQKTMMPVRVPIMEDAECILDRHKDDPETLNTDRVFRPMSNQVVNRCLSVLAKVFDIRKKVTFHVARHTFATTISMSNGVPIETVSKMLGHSKMATTQLYARVVEEKVSADMQLLKKRLMERRAGLRGSL